MEPPDNSVFPAAREILLQAAVGATALDEHARRVVEREGEVVAREIEDDQQNEADTRQHRSPTSPGTRQVTPFTVHDANNRVRSQCTGDPTWRLLEDVRMVSKDRRPARVEPDWPRDTPRSRSRTRLGPQAH